MLLIRALWRGEVALSTAFWLVYIMGNGLLYAVMDGILGSALPGIPTTGEAIIFGVAGLAFTGIALAYWVISVVCVWRSADHYQGSAFWRFLAYIFVIVVMIVPVSSCVFGVVS